MDISKLKINLEHEDVEKIKATIFILAAFNVFLFLASTFFLVKGMFTLSYILSLGVIAYILAIFYEVERVEHKLLEKLEGKLKRVFKFLIRFITGSVFVVMVFLLIMYFLNLPFYDFSLYDHLLSFLAIPILIFPLIFWSKLMNFMKGRFGKGLLVIVILLLLLPTVFGANSNETEESDLEKISEGISTIQKFMNIMERGTKFLKEQRNNFEEMFGFTKSQSTIFMALIALIAIFIALKIIRTLIKWAIIIIIVWLALQFLGVLSSVSLPELLPSI